MDITIVRNDIPGLSAKIQTAVAAGWNTTGAQLLASAQAAAPVDTGELRDSGSISVSGTTLTIQFSADHAVYVHEGTRYMGARPFLRTTLEQAASAIESGMGSAIESGLS